MFFAHLGTEFGWNHIGEHDALCALLVAVKVALGHVANAWNLRQVEFTPTRPRRHRVCPRLQLSDHSRSNGIDGPLPACGPIPRTPRFGHLVYRCPVAVDNSLGIDPDESGA